MKVLYDSQIFGMQDYGGISRYFVELIKRISKRGVDTRLNCIISHNSPFKELNIGIYDKFLVKNRYRNYVYSIINLLCSIPKLIFSRYDIYHPTYYALYFLPFVKKKRMVVTVYDMVHELFSTEYPSLRNNTLKYKQVLLNRADNIIAISENTKKDVVNIYGINPDKISVIYLGNSLEKWDGKKRLTLPSKYILYVGNRWIYKNFDKFIKSTATLIKNKRIQIVCAGGERFSDDEKILFKNLNIELEVIHQPISSDQCLSECYARAEVFVYPSKYEGFGIPVLEAFTNRCPVAVSNTSSFPEVAQNAAIYFNPEESKSITAAINKILISKTLREKLIKAGELRLKNFSWESTAKETLKVYMNNTSKD